ncbi:MAG TPA: HlyC/CorC family transporter, partial [Candidatus Tenderia electrophaga]|nr:HlyC/CorC family transporter [Candidatus Tenderia electrophaga]
MEDISLNILFTILFFLIILSACFSASETAMMSLNRYKLRHQVQTGHAGAIRAQRLLDRTDRLIGLILLGNNFVNILASSIATLIALRLMGQAGIAIATGILTFVILIFAEVAPKTLAAMQPERVAFPASFVLEPLLKVSYPLVWLVNIMANAVLRSLGVPPKTGAMQHLSSEELRTVVNEAGALIPRRHQEMLISILDLEKVSVEDIMVPRNEIVGLDISDDNQAILKQLIHSQHTRLPVFRDNIENVIGFVHARNALHILAEGEFSKEKLLGICREPYFIPEGTPLNTQILGFQREKRRIAFVVDEYGDIQGLVSLESILEEIVGEYTTDVAASSKDIHPQDDGSFLVDGTAYVRELNRTMGWELPTNGPKTFNGLIVEYLESIPKPGTSVLISGYPIDIIQTGNNT